MSEKINNKMMQRIMMMAVLMTGLFFVNACGAMGQGGKVTPTPTPTTTKAPTPAVPAKEIKNLLGMEFVYVPNGSFEMGSIESDDEKVHQVTISNGFYMGKYEVTQDEYKKVMGTNPSYFKNCSRCPVEMVSWDDAQKFIVKLNAKGDGTYRLPTESEWEYSDRAGKTGDFLRAVETGWYKSNSKGKTHPVGTKQANAWGLYDMSGNVWEWVEDRYGDYPSEGVIDPKGASSGAERVFRGASIYDDNATMSTEGRQNAETSYTLERIGFRVVRTK